MRQLLAAALFAAALASTAPAFAHDTPLPGADLYTVTEAGGQLFWTSSVAGATVTLYTRPAAGGATRALGSVAGPGAGTYPYVAFDGANYALLLYREQSTVPDPNDCGVCENLYDKNETLVAGRLDGTPKVAYKCVTSSDGGSIPPGVAIAAGRTFVARLTCKVPPGILELDAAGALTGFDAAGDTPLSAAGNWLAYATLDTAKAVDLTGSGSYTVARPMDKPLAALWRALYVQSDGSLVSNASFHRTGGTTPKVPLRARWTSFSSDVLFAGDRLFYRDTGDLTQIRLTPAEKPLAIAAPGLAVKRALVLNGSLLDVAAYSCTGQVILRTLDLQAPTPPGAVDGCPLKVTTGALRLTKQRTITVSVSCTNGCKGKLSLHSGDVRVPRRFSGSGTLRFRLTSKQVKGLRQTATFVADDPWLTADTRAHKIR